MAKITLSEGFSIVPEGTHIFEIVNVDYKEEFGKLEVRMKTAKGQTHIERFSLMRNDGSLNEGALNAFSYFAKVALNDFSLEEIDHEDLVGHYIECVVEHEEVPSTRNPGKMTTFARLGDKFPASGFLDQPQKGINLDALLG
jgi:hypothetical protein